jgi:periplasmic mercuric ion binding protein
MTRLITVVAFGAALISVSTVQAAERTVTLSVQNMYCAACPYTVRASLQAVPGVKNVVVSFPDKTAVVTYDDVEATLDVLTAATKNAGYPSTLKGEPGQS